MTESDVTWLTQDAYDRLAAEIEYLSGPARVEIAKKIEEARQEGDLRENGGYHAAKEEQGKQEARIRQLRALLESAQVGTAPVSAADGIAPGMAITATVAGEKSTFILGNREVSGDTELDVYSDQSPLGAAIIGAHVGDTVSYRTPAGKEISVTLHGAEPFTG